MKMRKNTVLSAIIAAFLVLSMLAATGCGSKNDTAEVETTTAVQETSVPDESVAVPESTAAEETVTNGASEVTETTAEAFVLPQEIPEIVELFNKSANRIKPEAKKVVKNYEKRIVDKENLVVPKSLESTAETLIDTFMKDDTEPIVYSTKEDIRNEYIVPNQDYVSKLRAEDVREAACKDMGDKYEIRIVLKNEKNPVTGKGVGSVCDIIEAHEVEEKASFIEEFSTEYNNCEVRMTVDKESGRVTHSIYVVNLILNVRVNLFGTHSAAIGLTFEKDYSVTY